MGANKVLKFLKLEGIAEHLSGYLEDRIELLKLELQENAVEIGAKAFIFILALLSGAFCALFASIALAIVINQTLGHTYLGYLIIAAGYLLLLIIIYSLRNHHVIKKLLYKAINKS